MSYPTYLIKTLPATLRSSTGLAILASLSIHGILLNVLQVLPIDLLLGKVQSPRAVGLVELTPSEQSLLPQVSKPPVTLPTFVTQSSILPPLQPEPLPRILQPPITKLPSVWSGLPPAPSRNNLSMAQSIPIPESPPSIAPNLLPVPPANNSSMMPLIPIPGKLPSDSVQKVKYGSSSSVSNTLSRLKPANVTDAVRSFNAQKNANQLENQEISRATPTASTRPAISQEHWTRAKLVAALQREQSKYNSSSTSASTITSTQPVISQEHWTRAKLVAALQREQSKYNSSSTSTSTITSTQPVITPIHWTRAKLVAALWGQQPEQNSSSTSAATAQLIAQVNDFKEWYQKVHSSNPKLATNAPIRQKIKTCQKQLDGGVAIFGMVS